MTLTEILRCFYTCVFGQRPRFIFNTVNFEGVKLGGNIDMIQMEFSQAVTLTASPLDRRGRPAQIEAGTAQWSLQLQDSSGNEVTDAQLEVNPNNELEARLVSGETEATGTVTLRADGDPDLSEEAPIIGTASVVIDTPNAVAFELANTDPIDV